MEQGFGSGKEFSSNRLINKDGTFNIVRIGAVDGFKDFYRFLLSLSWPKFFGFTFFFYIGVNLIFSTIYYFGGSNTLSSNGGHAQSFFDCFNFSVQTLTSLGYGSISPSSVFANIIVAIESFLGILSIALTTGLLYARFSKPETKILFTDKILFSTVNDLPALMIKVVNGRKSVLLNAKAKMILSLNIDGNSSDKQYHILNLQVKEITFFPLTWTIVHFINDESPISGLDYKTFLSRNPEVICTIEAFDETHSQSLIAIQSFADQQWVENKKFVKSFNQSKSGETILDINSLNKLEDVD